MDVPVTLEISERHHATEEGNAAEDDEDPTDDRNRERPPFHWATMITRIRMELLTRPSLASIKESAATKC